MEFQGFFFGILTLFGSLFNKLMSCVMLLQFICLLDNNEANVQKNGECKTKKANLKRMPLSFSTFQHTDFHPQNDIGRKYYCSLKSNNDGRQQKEKA